MAFKRDFASYQRDNLTKNVKFICISRIKDVFGYEFDELVLGYRAFEVEANVITAAKIRCKNKKGFIHVKDCKFFN